MGATLEETLAELNASQPGTPSGPQSPAGPSAGGSGGGAATAQGSSPATPPLEENPDGATGSFMRGLGDTVTFGFLDEAGALIDSVGGTDGRANIWNSNEGFGDVFEANVARNRAILKSDDEHHNTAQTIGQVAGGLIIPISRIGAGVKGVAAAGAAQGAVYGAGSGEGLGDRAAQAGVGLVAGGVLGGILGKVGEVVGPKVKALFGKTSVEGAGEVIDDPVEGLIGRVTDESGPYNETQVPAHILGLDETGQPILAALPEGEAQAPLNAIVKVTPEGGAEAGASKASPKPLEGTPGESTDLVKLTLPAVRGGAEEGSEETVGTIGREELAALQAGIARKAPEITANERSADITWENSPDVARRVGEWRIGSLGGSAEARAMLSGLAHTVGPKTRRSDVDLMREARARADAIGEDPEAMLVFAKELAGDVEGIDTAIATVQTVWSRMSADVTDLHLMGVDWSTASDDLVAEAAQRIYNLQTLSAEFQKVKTGLGRGLRVRQLPTADDYLNRITQRAQDGVSTNPENLPAVLPETRDEIGNWLEIWGTTGGDPRRQAAVLQGRVTLPSPGKYLRTSVANFFTASILSAPRTVTLNLIGPGVIQTIRQIERHAGASVTSIAPWLSREERQAARAVAQTSAKAWVTTFTEVQDVFRMALVAAQRNRTVVGGGGSAVDTVSGFGPITQNLRNAANMGTSGLGADFAYGLGNAINVFPRAFARVNNGLDEFAKRMSYQTEVRTDAMVAAASAGPDGTPLTGAAYLDYVEQRMAGAYDPEGHATSAELLRMAERTTLTAQVGEKGSNLRGFGNAIQKARNAVPELRFIIPVFNVPVNGIAETMRRLPIGGIPYANRMLGFSRTADELAGVYGPVEQADAHGRVLLGASFLTAGTMLAQAGRITGSGPQDPTDREVWLATHQPYSIKVGDEWVRYDKYDILGGLMSIPATIHDATIYNPDDKAVQDIFFSGIGALAQWFKDKAALRNATGILAMGDDPTRDVGTMFTRLGGNIASSIIPAAVRVTLTDNINPELAMRRGWMDYIQAATPVWAGGMEPIRNVLGEPVIKPASSPGESIFPVTLVKAIGYDEDPVLDELDRLYQVTGYGAGADSSALSYGFFDPKDVELEDGRSVDYRAMQLRQTMKIDGKTLRQTLQETFSSQEYNEAVDGDSQAKATSRGEASRGYLVSQVFKTWNGAIKQTLAAESPIARDWLLAASAKRRDDAYLRDTSAAELVANPALYAAKGVDRSTLEEGLTGNSSTDALLSALGAN